MTDIDSPSPKSQMQRRELLRHSAMAGAVLAGTTLIPKSATAQRADKFASWKDGATILFQGDSITDAGRSRRHSGANNAAALGNGYPKAIASYLLATNPTKQFRILNRGISGNKVPDLAKRWKKDCLELKPDVLSILIGVNDIWHKLNGRYKGTVKDYEQGFTDLLETTKNGLPDVKLVICEPFVLRCGAVNDSWFPEFEERRAAAKRVAEKFEANWAPFQSMFDENVNDHVKPEYWAADGVHPTVAGHGLMAMNWLQNA